jgi:hypothetical protein
VVPTSPEVDNPVLLLFSGNFMCILIEDNFSLLLF